MLSYMRENAGSWLIKILLIFVALSFVIGFGLLPGLKDNSEEGLIVAEIGDRKITKRDWDFAYKNMVEFYKRLYKDRFSEQMLNQMDLRGTALDQLINDALQIQEAKRLGFKISDKELKKTIQSLPYFQTEGTFSKEKYLRLLSLNRMNPKKFETQQRDLLLTQLFQQFIRGTVKISDQELWNQYLLENEKVALDVMPINPIMLEATVVVTEEALQEYFKAHEDDFLTPKKVNAAYVQFPPEKYNALVKVYTGDIEEYYNNHIDEYSTPEELHLRHILLRLLPDADDDARQEKRTALEGLKERIEKGENFAALAKTFSEDPSRDKGGDLGYIKRGELLPEVEKAAFALKPGKISDIVSSSYGLHLLKVDDYREAKVDPLEEVKEKIKDKLTQEKSWHLARRKAEEYMWEAKDLGTFPGNDTKDENSAVVKETDYFARGEPILSLGRESAFQQIAFAMEPNQMSEVIKGDKGYYIIKTLAHKPPEAPLFDSVRGQVEKQYRAQESKKLAQEKAEQILQAAHEGKTFAEIAKEEKLKKFETKPFSRLDSYLPKIGASAELIESAFSLTKQAPLPEKSCKINEKYYVIRFKERTLPQQEQFQTEKQSFRVLQLNKKTEDVFRQRLSELRQQSSVKTAPAAI